MGRKKIPTVEAIPPEWEEDDEGWEELSWEELSAQLDEALKGQYIDLESDWD